MLMPELLVHMFTLHLARSSKFFFSKVQYPGSCEQPEGKLAKLNATVGCSAILPKASNLVGCMICGQLSSPAGACSASDVRFRG